MGKRLTPDERDRRTRMSAKPPTMTRQGETIKGLKLRLVQAMRNLDDKERIEIGELIRKHHAEMKTKYLVPSKAFRKYGGAVMIALEQLYRNLALAIEIETDLILADANIEAKPETDDLPPTKIVKPGSLPPNQNRNSFDIY